MAQRTAKLIPNGRSQAVRLPKEFQFQGKEVYIRKEGRNVVLSPKPESWDAFFSSESKVTADFMTERMDLPLQDRELL